MRERRRCLFKGFESSTELSVVLLFCSFLLQVEGLDNYQAPLTLP